MAKISELLSKPIISIFDAKIVGTICNIYFDSKMAKGVVLSLFSDELDEPSTRYVPLSKLAMLESDAVVIKDSGCVTYEWNTELGAQNPINSPAFTQDGKRLGIVRDVILDGLNVASFVVDNNEIAASTLFSHSKDALIFNDTGKPIKQPPRKKIPTPKTYQRIELHYPTSPSLAPTPTPLTSPTPTSKDSPPATLKEAPPVTLKEPPSVTLKESPPATLKEPPPATFKEPPSATLKESPSATLKEPAAALKDLIAAQLAPTTVLKEAPPTTKKEAATVTLESANLEEQRESHFESIKEASIDLPKLIPQSSTATEGATESLAAENGIGLPKLIPQSSTPTEGATENLATENGIGLPKLIPQSSTPTEGATESLAAENGIGLPKLIPQSSTNVSRTPARSGDVDNKFDFLIGKLLERDIYSGNEELLIRANTVITAEVITLCKRHSRLVQLALHSTATPT